jgi:hypothetical protein
MRRSKRILLMLYPFESLNNPGWHWLTSRNISEILFPKKATTIPAQHYAPHWNFEGRLLFRGIKKINGLINIKKGNYQKKRIGKI